MNAIYCMPSIYRIINIEKNRIPIFWRKKIFMRGDYDISFYP